MTKNMGNSPPRQFREDPIFGDKWEQLAKLYKGLNFHQKNYMTPHVYQKKNHPKNYNKIFRTISKKWMRVNNEGKNTTVPFIMTWFQSKFRIWS